MTPWGPLPRHHYDFLNNHQGRIALNTLRHTRHEPITRIFVVEESWCKKYDLPDWVWKMRYGDTPKLPNKYCHLRAELTPNGACTRFNTAWVLAEGMRALEANPRLHEEAQRMRPMVIFEPERAGLEMAIPSDQQDVDSAPAGTTLGN